MAADEHPAVALLRRILPAMREADGVAEHEGQKGCGEEIAAVEAFLADIDKGGRSVDQSSVRAEARETRAAPCSHPKISAYGAGEKAVCHTCGADPRVDSGVVLVRTEDAPVPCVFELQALTVNGRKVGSGDVRSVELDLQRYRVSPTRLEFNADGKVGKLVLVDKRDKQVLGQFVFRQPIDARVGDTVTLEGVFDLEALTTRASASSKPYGGSTDAVG